MSHLAAMTFSVSTEMPQFEKGMSLRTSRSHLAHILEVHVRKLAVGLAERVVQGPLRNSSQAAEEILLDTEKFKERHWIEFEHHRLPRCANGVITMRDRPGRSLHSAGRSAAGPAFLYRGPVSSQVCP